MAYGRKCTMYNCVFVNVRYIQIYILKHVTLLVFPLLNILLNSLNNFIFHPQA